MIEIALDTDIGWDSDDLLALLYLLSRTDVRVVSLTCTPGRQSQLELLSSVLHYCGKAEVPIGFPSLDHIEFKHVNSFHTGLVAEFIGATYPLPALRQSEDLLWEVFKDKPETRLITIGPLTNIRRLLEKYPDVRIEKSFTMGGYIDHNAGIPFPRKFEGRSFCPEFNFNGDAAAARYLAAAMNITEKYFISKNITHLAVIPGWYLDRLHLGGFSSGDRPLLLMAEALRRLGGRGKNKKYHDPLTVCAALNDELVGYEEVEMEIKGKEHGARPAVGTNNFMSVWFDHGQFCRMFLQALLGPGGD